MKSLIIKCVVVVLLGLGVSNYLLYVKTGKMPFSLDSFKLPSMPSLTDAPANILGGKEQAYKWTDKNGVTHYSSEPPTEVGYQAEIMQVDPNTNLVQGLEQKEDINPQLENNNTTQPSGSFYQPKNAKKLMDDAKAVQDIMNERAKQLEGI